MKLVFPNMLYKEKAVQLIEEFYEYGSEINGSGGLERYLKDSSYEEWLKKLNADLDMANIPTPRVPGLTYFYVREEDDTIVGMINMRLSSNDFIKNEVGHIGYCIRPTERRKHYATDMVQSALKVYDTLGMKEIVLTCDKVNLASSGVIKNCGGELQREYYSDLFQTEVQKYVIKRNRT